MQSLLFLPPSYLPPTDDRRLAGAPRGVATGVDAGLAAGVCAVLTPPRGVWAGDAAAAAAGADAAAGVGGTAGAEEGFEVFEVIRLGYRKAALERQSSSQGYAAKATCLPIWLRAATAKPMRNRMKIMVSRKSRQSGEASVAMADRW
mmetsp:Transcript_4459/g.9588  ORF Transcript_4459/g.9588 Transcript_4459/m.9588 type:complete len:147 (+) Transcript_4459:6-446(+)